MDTELDKLETLQTLKILTRPPEKSEIYCRHQTMGHHAETPYQSITFTDISIVQSFQRCKQSVAECIARSQSSGNTCLADVRYFD